MVNSMKQMYKKVILTSFSVEPVLSFDQLTKIPTPTRCKEFCHMAMRWICKLERRPERSMAAYSVFVVAYKQFLLQSRLSDSIEQYNEPPGLQRNFTKSHFVVQIYPDGCPVRRFSGRHWRNDWRETLFHSQDIISDLRWTYLCCIVL